MSVEVEDSISILRNYVFDGIGNVALDALAQQIEMLKEERAADVATLIEAGEKAQARAERSEAEVEQLLQRVFDWKERTASAEAERDQLLQEVAHLRDKLATL